MMLTIPIPKSWKTKIVCSHADVRATLEATKENENKGAGNRSNKDFALNLTAPY